MRKVANGTMGNYIYVSFTYFWCFIHWIVKTTSLCHLWPLMHTSTTFTHSLSRFGFGHVALLKGTLACRSEGLDRNHMVCIREAGDQLKKGVLEWDDWGCWKTCNCTYTQRKRNIRHPDQWEPYRGGSCIYSKCTSAISQGQKIHQRQSEDPAGSRSRSRQGFVLFIQRLLGHWFNWLECRYHWDFLWLFCSWKMKLKCFSPRGRSEITDMLSSS